MVGEANLTQYFLSTKIQQNMMNKDIREATGDRVDICHLNTDS